MCILNEFGQVLAFMVTPNDTRKFVEQLLKQIWATPGRSIITQVVYTDNPTVDESTTVQAFYNPKFPHHLPHKLHVLLVQLIWNIY